MIKFPDHIKKIVIYSRKSRLDETDEVLKRQLQMLISIADFNNVEWEVFQETGTSMSIKEEDRPEINKVLRKIRNHEVDAILVTDLDRLSRDMEHSAHIKKILANYGVYGITTTKIYDFNLFEDDLMSDVDSLVSKQEYKRTVKRLARGRREAAKEGIWLSKAPLGYKLDRNIKKLVIDEETASVVKRIYELYLSGLSSTAISRKLEVEGITTPTGAKFVQSRVANILRDEVYKGVAVFGRSTQSRTEKTDKGKIKRIPVDKEEQIRVENAHEAIISNEDWEKVANIRKARNSSPIASRLGKNPFSSLIECSTCGRKHSFQKDGKNEGLRIQSCQTRNYKDNSTYTVCANQGVQLFIFEEGFYKELSKFANQLEKHLDLIKSSIKGEEIFDSDLELERVNKALKLLDSQRKKVQRGYLSGIFEEVEVQEEIKKIKIQEEQLMQEIEEINNMNPEEKVETMEKLLIDLRSILSGKSNMEPKDLNQLFKAFIEKIEYTRVGIKSSNKTPINIKIHYKNF